MMLLFHLALMTMTSAFSIPELLYFDFMYLILPELFVYLCEPVHTCA